MIESNAMFGPIDRRRGRSGGRSGGRGRGRGRGRRGRRRRVGVNVLPCPFHVPS